MWVLRLLFYVGQDGTDLGYSGRYGRDMGCSGMFTDLNLRFSAKFVTL